MGPRDDSVRGFNARRAAPLRGEAGHPHHLPGRLPRRDLADGEEIVAGSHDLVHKHDKGLDRLNQGEGHVLWWVEYL